MLGLNVSGVKEVSLKVLEAYTEDVGRKVARIDHIIMNSLGASPGDVIKIKGKKCTVAKCLPLTSLNEGKEIIRIDGLIRNNASATIGDIVIVEKTDALPARKVTVVPLLEAIPPIDEKYLVDTLEGCPVTNGDNVMIPYFGGRLTFQVIETFPKVFAVLVTQRTSFKIRIKPPSVNENIRHRIKWIQQIESDTGADPDKTEFIITNTEERAKNPDDILIRAKKLAKEKDEEVEVRVELWERRGWKIATFPWAIVQPDGSVDYVYQE